MIKKIIIFFLFLTVAGIAIWLLYGRNNTSPLSSIPEINLDGDNSQNEANWSLGVISQGLQIPWDIAFLPDGSLLITERPGNLVLVSSDGSKERITVPEVSHRGEGGLLGVALHPEFESNNLLYLYLTTSQNAQGTRNAVIRYNFENNKLTEDRVIIDNIPGAMYHDGGRIEFGPDGLLYITTGDAGQPNLAQNRDSLAGKILRVHDDGSIPEDNPFNTVVYSYGHRNPQGITWDNQGHLWSTEHGRSGTASGMDEVNLIYPGNNYGWPEVEGDENLDGMTLPIAHSGPTNTWAPASAIYWDGSIFFGGLRGEALYEAVLDGENITEIHEHLKGEYGRIRTIRVGPDGMFYLTTSNTDGRGRERSNDDKLIRIDPAMFR